MEAYDWRGNYIYPRGKCVIPEPFTDEVAKTYNYARPNAFIMEDAFKQYLNEYIKYCDDRGVKVYITVPYFLDEALRSTPEEMDAHDRCLQEQLDAPVISRTRDHIFSRRYIYNGIAHCNTEGAKHQTRLLYDDLYPYLN